MSIFSTILQKLGLQKPAAPPREAPHLVQPAAAPPPPAKAAAPPPMKTAAPPPPMKTAAPPSPMPAAAPPPPVAPAAAKAPAAIPVVDVVSQLEAMAAKNPAKLNWKNSIVDLLKLLGMDSSYEARKELAVELGCPAYEMQDSARMNVWLHKTVLAKIAENGGNIPKELLD